MSAPDTTVRAVGRRSFLAAATVAIGALATACGDDSGNAGNAAGTSSSVATSTTAPVTPAPASTAPPLAQFVVRGPTGHERVALTFHTNGEVDLVDELLDVFARRHVHVTTFIVGEWLDANPDMAARIAAAGHEFANHTYTHPTFGDLSRDGMLDEV